ncbi:MAG: hypothetical protein P3B98_05535 [Gemmatimonadota bacterium]|nr:hypothetical protein [Gemmatimonadota bacterium]
MQSALLWRQSGLWVLTRLVYAVVLAVTVSSPVDKAANNAWHFQPAVIVLCAALGAVEIYRRGERLLIGNLGIGPFQLGGLLAAAPFAAELAVAMLGRA